MPFYINTSNIKKTNERFNLSNFMEFTNSVYDSLSSNIQFRIKYLPLAGKFKVSEREAKRPDLISYEVYGNTQFWWLIMMYNGIIDFTKIAEGAEVVYPSLADIESLYKQLKKDQNS